MESALGAGFALHWAQQTVLSDLGGRTPVEALDAGMTPKEVWAVVWRVLELPARDR
jgi:hypothetical protein